MRHVQDHSVRTAALFVLIRALVPRGPVRSGGEVLQSGRNQLRLLLRKEESVRSGKSRIVSVGAVCYRYGDPDSCVCHSEVSDQVEEKSMDES